MAAIPASRRWDDGERPAPGDRDAFIAAFEGRHPGLTRVVDAAPEVSVWPI
jgi:6-hydroxynicotinate 3-monooxygenase